jgi:hypothetical protein
MVRNLKGDADYHVRVELVASFIQPALQNGHA